MRVTIAVTKIACLFTLEALAVALGSAFGVVTLLLLAVVGIFIYRKIVMQKYTFAINPPLHLPQLRGIQVLEAIGSGIVN